MATSTSTSYNASYVGVVQGLAAGRSAVNNTKLAATANTIALQIQTELSSPSLSAAKQSLLTQVVAATLTGRYTESALPAATITAIAAEYTALTTNIVD